MIGSMIADSARLSVGYVQKLLTDVPAEQFARLAVVEGKTIQSNHPAFILGHLSLYPVRIVTELGGDPARVAPSEKYEALFSAKATCLDDPDGTLYPPMDEITDKFFAAHEVAIEAVLAADDAAFAKENPNEGMRKRFATVGSGHAFYLGGHIMIHVGQFSAWRRMLGLPGA